MKQLRFLHSPVAANIIALLAFLTSLTSVVYSYKQQRFAESSYSEEKRGSIRLLLSESESIMKRHDEEVTSAMASIPPTSPVYPFLLERKRFIDEFRKDTNFLIRALDMPVFRGDPRFWNFMESSMKLSNRQLEAYLETARALDARPSQVQPSATPNAP